MNEQFQVSRQFWSYLVGEGAILGPQDVHQPGSAHEFRLGRRNVDFLRRRHAALKEDPFFRGMEFSDDSEVIRSGRPCSCRDARSPAVRCDAHHGGHRCRFRGAHAQLIDYLTTNGAKLGPEQRVTGLKQQ